MPPQSHYQHAPLFDGDDVARVLEISALEADDEGQGSGEGGEDP